VICFKGVSYRRFPRLLAIGLALGVGLSMPIAAGAAPFPEPRPTTPAEAIALLCPDLDSRSLCIRAHLSSFHPSSFDDSVGVRRATELLAGSSASITVLESIEPSGIVIRFDAETPRVTSIGRSGDSSVGSLAQVDATREGLEQARALLVGQLELPAPRLSEVVIAELGDRVDGFFVPGRGRAGTGRIVLDATPTAGPEGLRRAAIRQYAYATAVGMNYGLPPGWAEAFATWTSIKIGGLDANDEPVLSARLEGMDAGLLSPAPALAAGNALWFAFVEQAYGLNAIRLMVQELSGAQPVALALDRAMRRASDLDLGDAFREFHLWSVLTGERSDDRHFDFASQLRFPGFVTESRGLPALSVHREAPISALGSDQVLLLPQESHGGMRVHFEGDLSADWNVDLVIVNRRGIKHRVPVSLSPERRGEVVAPLDDLQEAWLLVRNVGSDDGAAHRYSYFASYEPGFPFEMSELRVRRQASAEDRVVVAWDTAIEHDLVGFNILRRLEGGDVEQTINPVWIPALGGFADETSYRYVDRTAEPGVSYVYRIQGITTSGLSSYSEPTTIDSLTDDD
jgi:hypothetical protein